MSANIDMWRQLLESPAWKEIRSVLGKSREDYVKSILTVSADKAKAAENNKPYYNFYDLVRGRIEHIDKLMVIPEQFLAQEIENMKKEQPVSLSQMEKEVQERMKVAA